MAPRPTRVAALALAAALLLFLAVASTATAAAPRQFYGVVAAEPLPDESELAVLGRGNIGTLRINLAWGSVQPAAGAPFDWSHYDALIGGAARNGIRVLPTVYSSPSWLTGSPETPPRGSDLGRFHFFLQEAVRRYGPSGTFWSENPLIPKLPIQHWQAWNEPNSPTFWRPRPKPKQYVALLRAFSDAIRGADPSAQILLGGLFLTPRIKKGIFLEKYLPALYRHGARRLFDAVALHPYSKTPKLALEAIRDVRRLMARFKDRKKPLWITEIGWATGGKRTPLTVGAGRQAKYLRQIFKRTAANRGRFKIGGVTWYSLRDIPGNIWLNHTGLFTEGFGTKPSWNAFVRLTGGSS
ncbi:MAG: hypothetical protein ACRDL6_11345 [Solirubrobacterales bacterium]